MRSLSTPALSLTGAAALGFAAAAVCFAAWAPKPASAQFGKLPQAPATGLPGTLANQYGGGSPAPPQPLEVQGLGQDRFVVATREPRLVTADGKTAQNMLLTVVTYYTVREGRLIPTEHVKVPSGYQLVTVEQ